MMKTKRHDFDWLDLWASLPNTGPEKVVSDDTIAVLERVAQLLLGDETPSKVAVTQENFASIVRDMRKLKHEGARALGEAILEASDWLDKQQLAESRAVYEHFLSRCGSKFYTDIARNQLRNQLKKIL